MNFVEGVRLGVTYDHQGGAFQRTEMNKRLSVEAGWRLADAWWIAGGYHDDDWSNGTTLSLTYGF